MLNWPPQEITVKPSVKGDQGELLFGEDIYVRFRDLIRAKSGIFFGDRKTQDLKNGVLKAFHYSGLGTLEEYCRVLATSPGNSAIFKTLISFLTVGETYFFRHFDVIEKEILPRLIKAHQHDKSLRIWSAGCSTGEEPFTVAMVLDRILSDRKDWTITIIGTDININSLQYAKEGVYRPWSLRSINEYYKERYFRRKEGLYYLDDRIRQMVKFDYNNLVDESYPQSDGGTKELDMILCRNVTIYFEAETTIRVVNRFYECLKERSYLAVGHAEPSSLIYDAYLPEIYPDAVLYRKDSSAKRESRYKTGIKIRDDIFRNMKKTSSQKDQAASGLQDLEKQITRLKDITSPVVIPMVPVPLEPKRATLSQAGSLGQGASAEERRQRANETELFAEAVQRFHERAFEESEKLFVELVEAFPNNGRAYYMIAHIAANLDQVKKSKEFCHRAIEKDPLLLEAYYLLGLIFKEENDFENSISMLKKTIYIDMDFALGYYEMAVNYFKLGDTVGARKYLKQTERILKTKKADVRIGILDDLTVRELGMMINMWDKG